MKTRFGIPLLFVTALSLCGCTDSDWDNALSLNSVEHPNAPAVVPTGPTEATTSDADVTVAATPPSTTYVPPGAPRVAEGTSSLENRFCDRVARSNAATSAQEGSDPAMQQQAGDAVYRECMTFYGAH
jgi:hypothetical protein